MSDRKKLIYALVYSGIFLLVTVVFTIVVRVSGMNADQGHEDKTTPTPTLIATLTPAVTDEPKQPTETPTPKPTLSPTPTPTPMPDASEVIKKRLLDKRLADEVGSDFIAIEKTVLGKFNVTIENMYTDRYFNIKFETDEGKKFEPGDFYIVAGGILSRGAFECKEEAVYIKQVSIEQDGVFKIECTSVYECKSYEDDEFYYIGFIQPKEKYDKVVVIDAGHGGWDTGGYTEGYKVLEKDCNLAIALELEKLLKQEGIGVYLTRSTDLKLSNTERVLIAESFFADYLISIHSDIKDDGIKVFCAADDNSGEEAVSVRLAEKCAEALKEDFVLEEEAVITDNNNDSLLGILQTPAVMIEFDFITNNAEQKAAAEAILQAIKAMDGSEGL